MATAKKVAAKKTAVKAVVKAKPPTIKKPPPKAAVVKAPPVKKPAAKKTVEPAIDALEDRLDIPATPRSRIASLRPTDTPGVFKNRANVLVDVDGVAISLRNLKKAAKDHATEVIGRAVETPLDVMLVNALDPRLPNHVRHAAAKDAAPYIHAKKVAIQGGDTPINVSHSLEGKTLDELRQMRQHIQALKELAEKAAGK